MSLSRGAIALASLAFVCAGAGTCQAQSHEVVCNAGDGGFESAFRTGVTVWVGAARSGELATRSCAAELRWNKQKQAIAAGAPRIDVDAFGADLGLGVPVAALQIQKAGAACCMAYQIYSLQQPPRLLRTITGGDSFGAADTDLDGRIEIWTDDSAAFDGFEKLDVRQLEAAPAIVLRFSKGQLLDVSSEFQPYFDAQIAAARAQLEPEDLRDFKSSDGRLAATSDDSFEDLRDNDRLQVVKLKILQIVWAYLYSGRDREAWHSLDDLWPAADVERIRAAILKARDRGIRSQVDGASTELPSARKEHAPIFDGIRPQLSGIPAGIPAGMRPRSRGIEPMSIPEKSPRDLVLPEPIQLWSPPSMGESEVMLDLLVDAAGKVRSAEGVDRLKPATTDLIQATAEWKFIPAFKDGRAVACRVRVSASPKR